MLNKLYDSNWKTMRGLQMSEVLANYGYKLVKTLPVKTVLDIGCGDGTNMEALSQLGFNIEGCDISRLAVKLAKKKGFSAKVVNLNTDILPYRNNSFDLVWCTETIEHVADPDFVLTEILRVLKPRGSLFITTPNISWFGNRFQVLLGKTLEDLHAEHLHWYNPRTLHQLLGSKFRIQKEMSYIRIVPFPLTRRVTLLERLNYIGYANSFFSYSLATLAT